jgi:hypothetical protein
MFKLSKQTVSLLGHSESKEKVDLFITIFYFYIYAILS